MPERPFDQSSQASKAEVESHAGVRQEASYIGARRQESHCASLSEKTARLQALTNEEYEKLLRWAEFTARKFRGKVNDADAEDLLHHAILQALNEPRKWRPQKIDFLMFIGGCIRSVAYSWYKRAKPQESVDILISPINQPAQVDASITLDWARHCLRGRRDAVKVFDLMRAGYKGPEIQQSLGINKGVYSAAYKWIFRTCRREGYRE